MTEVRLPNVDWLVIPAHLPAPLAPVAERVRRASSAYLSAVATVNERQRRVNDAAAADQAAAADALLSGESAPAATQPDADAALSEARQQLQVVMAASPRGTRGRAAGTCPMREATIPARGPGPGPRGSALSCEMTGEHVR